VDERQCEGGRRGAGGNTARNAFVSFLPSLFAGGVAPSELLRCWWTLEDMFVTAKSISVFSHINKFEPS
jgi:hypothetical protein